jgi:DNA modification methylase
LKNGNIDITYYKPTELIAAEYNPRQLTKDQHKDLTDSIKRFGLVDPLIVNTHKERKNVLIGGHQRLKIATMLGLKEIPCVEVELNPAKEKELNIRLNKNVGEWDWDALANYFDVGELTEWGFTDDELQFYEDEPTEGLIDDDEVPEVEEAITKQGDLWLLGEHRLLCGDATKKEDVEVLMDGNKAELMITDPPYGINADKMTMGTGKKDFYRGDWDSKKPNISLLLTYCKKMIVWGGNYFTDILPITNDWLCWHKKNDGLSFSEFELAWTNLGKNTRHISHHWSGEKKKHPTQKPLEVFIWCLKLVDLNIVFDPFLGSGSTLIACEKTNRKCYGMEIDPHYCDVIVKRWEEFTGNKAERIEAASA